ncbi:dolichyl-diphosphooligosaccharide--protein glycosyltransferase subunit [Trichophyton mentagrophytes]|nr:dolichyl-diphosphooligosaccharide--protein glycosyltransferase subunit [Trichophyton mentagrophytes]GBF66210.1 dolichyl-diphosphooligosaccharide--protein glycosyltransferase subunit [Trichophyton mentagrophytes]
MAPKRREVQSDATTPPVSKMKQTTASSAVPKPLLSTSANAPAKDIILNIWDNYTTNTPQRTLLLDIFMAFLVVVGGIQFVYCVLAGNYPFNAFLSGFSAAVGQFVLTASLRMQTSDIGKTKSVGKSGVSSGADTPIQDRGEGSSERAFADYIFGSIVLHFFCINFIN